MHVGIDLGTTFSCISYIDDNGNAKVISNNDSNDAKNNLATPSVIWLNNGTAYVGEKANQLKITPSAPIFEYFKRDMGHPIDYIEGFPCPRPYNVDGFSYGAIGMSAILLRKLKKDALRFFKRNKQIPDNSDEKTFSLDAIITVPAYFGDKERQATKSAGYIAGLNVIGIINEPTAAALTYGYSLSDRKKLMIFDLGGGTFDVTILEIEFGDARVIASNGNKELGGKNWDQIIIDYFEEEYYRRTNNDIPENLYWDIRHKALAAKFELSENKEVPVYISIDDHEEEFILYSNNPDESDCDMSDLELTDQNKFYFDKRCSNLLSQCRILCLNTLEKANLNWDDIDEIILAGGSCRMPMIPEMLENISKMKIRRNIEGFSFDTAIAQGAAIYGKMKSKVKDVTPKTIGIKLIRNDRPFIEHLIIKDTPLPHKICKSYKAPPFAVLELFEGDSKIPDECDLRGRLELENEKGDVNIILEADADGVLSAFAEYPPDGKKSMQIKENGSDKNKRIEIIREKVQGINIII